MSARCYKIESRAKDIEVQPADRSDFATSAGRKCAPDLVLSAPGWSPYCIDAKLRELIFVRLPENVDLSLAAFYSVTQFREAQELVAMPLDDLPGLCAALPEPKLILVFSIGRCGSTLVSHLLRQPGRVLSLSEPSVFDATPFPGHQKPLRLSPDLLRHLAQLHLAAAKTTAGTLAVKFKSQSLFIADSYVTAFPDAKYVFLYRDALTWTNSFFQFLQGIGFPENMDRDSRAIHWNILTAEHPMDYLGRYVDLDADHVHLDRLQPVVWTLYLETYLRLLAHGVPWLA